MKFLLFIKTIFIECATSHTGRYEFLRVGSMIGATIFIAMTICHSVWNLPFDYLSFAGGYSGILAASGVTVGAKNWMEKK